MYSLTVQDHIMVAHSFKGEIFGPAQRVHGATFVVEWELRRARLDADGLINTTTEFLAGLIFELLKGKVAADSLGAGTGNAYASMKVILRESPVAWAAYEAALP
ncbi:MAG: 6-carboxytetrahydropterin synthase [Proteobacteria bacterium]|nr:6-carboxytetrahydropterin synthase [Pseudomonadota bacterium]